MLNVGFILLDKSLDALNDLVVATQFLKLVITNTFAFSSFLWLAATIPSFIITTASSSMNFAHFHLEIFYFLPEFCALFSNLV
jgi:hypothetical protein